jgi:hypothetical protein
MDRWRRRGHRWSRAALAAAALLVLVVGVLRANARYFYCPLMDAVASRPCCEPPHEGTGDDPAVDAPDCCTAMHVGALPSSASSTTVEVASAPLTAVIVAVAGAKAVAVGGVPRAELDARHRGPPPPGEARARTMVFLI